MDSTIQETSWSEPNQGQLCSRFSTFINLQYCQQYTYLWKKKKRHLSSCNGCYFEAWSGLRINLYKSFMVLPDHANLTFALILSILGCKAESFPINYLGILTRLGKLLRQEWVPFLDKRELETRQLEPVSSFPWTKGLSYWICVLS